MARHDITALKDFYEEIIGEMAPDFDSHEFILKMAERHQKEYVNALHSADGNKPFKSVHARLSNFLNQCPLVKRVSKVTSPDIFRNEARCSKWKKVT